MKPEWISVDARLPDSRRRVLVAQQTHIFGVRFRSQTVSIAQIGTGEKWSCGSLSRMGFTFVTHWAELPEVPEA